MMQDFVVKKVLTRKDGVKYIIIPKISEISIGDYVMISKMKNQEVKQ